MPQLLAMVERFWNSTQHFRRQFVKEAYAKDGFPFSDPQHLLLMDAIRARDVEAAQVLVRLHIRRTRVLIQTTEGGAAQPPIASRVPLLRARRDPRYRKKKAHE
jgi:DNA-binding GntR family transcriptional regulator